MATHAQRILDYLWSVAPDGATNSQITHSLQISSHQTIYMATQDLVRRGLVRSERAGHRWNLFAVEHPDAFTTPSVPMQYASTSSAPINPASFEQIARRKLSALFGVQLLPGTLPGVRKRFDYVSPDAQVVGDAKYYTRVGGIGLPPAKFSIIAEHVWLLEKTGARMTFLIFGNDRRVPELWLERYGNLAASVTFYFLTDDGRLDRLHPAVSATPDYPG